MLPAKASLPCYQFAPTQSNGLRSLAGSTEGRTKDVHWQLIVMTELHSKVTEVTRRKCPAVASCGPKQSTFSISTNTTESLLSIAGCAVSDEMSWWPLACESRASRTAVTTWVSPCQAAGTKSLIVMCTTFFPIPGAGEWRPNLGGRADAAKTAVLGRNLYSCQRCARF